MRRAYISGPMRGKRELNFAQFHAAERVLRAAGWEPVNPARLDEEAGVDPTAPARVYTPHEVRTFAWRDVAAILALRPECGDALVMLPGWEASKGATAEHALAEWVGLRVLTVEQAAGG